MDDRKLTYISLFSGAGVGCYGFKQEHFECIASCEMIPARLNIQKANHKCKYESGYIAGDLTTDAVKRRLLDEVALWRKTEGTEEVDVVVATPPCQGMSTANYKKGDESKRNSLVVEAISIIKSIKPKIFVFENVKAFMKTNCTDISGEIIPIKDSILRNLGEEYHIYARVINFKEYGVPSSRPRTIVIGTRKKYIHYSPLNIFPLKSVERTVRDAIGDLPALSFGEISATDMLHFFREYPRYMEEWIRNIKEGESAFQNPDTYKPYKVVDGEKVILKGAHMGNKFRRLFWDKPGACIATRSDLLASQDTIHPRDNRVLSIRELMRLMSIPEEFQWSLADITAFRTKEEKQTFLKDNELNIRRCIGEAVPTRIMRSIAKNIREMLEFEAYVEAFYSKKEMCTDFKRSFYINAFEYEAQLSGAKDSGSFYTPQSVVYEAISTLDFSRKEAISILEPAVGMGAFLPQLLRLCDACERADIDVCDCNPEALRLLKNSMKQIPYNADRIAVNYISDDFLTTDKLKQQYDVIVSNPPFARAEKSRMQAYRKQWDVGKSNNIFSFFLDRYLTLSEEIVVVLPKSFIMAPEYNAIRKKYEEFGIKRIVDFGVKYFKKVFVEILSFHFSKSYRGKTTIENKLSGQGCKQKHGYIYHDKSWLLYRNEWFDRYIETLRLDVFDVFRDRQITNQKMLRQGDIRVLRSKNILEDGKIIAKDGYDRYIQTGDLGKFAASRFLNSKAIIMPSFTYLTRATLLPDNCIPNGSIAILIPKEELGEVDLSLYSSNEFRLYYEIVKNKAKFTLNLDANAVYYIGVKKSD